jgi:hypothetical protein
MDDYRYILEPYKGINTRHTCPGCGKVKTFSLYIDTDTGENIAPNVGRCNRVDNCSYHYTPKQYFTDNNISIDQQPTKYINSKPLQPIKPISFIPFEKLEASRAHYEQNNLVIFLIDRFGIVAVNELIVKYNLGTSKHWPGASIFWQIDQQGRIRTGKIMLYDAITGHRTKEPANCITFVHSALKLYDYELKQCLFGEHLLQDKSRPIAVVESEKTAIIASIYLPQFNWVATSGAEGLSRDKCDVLNNSGLHVVLFPDVSKPKEGKPTAFERWNNTAKKHLKRFSVSELLEDIATVEERVSGLDLADYLLRCDIKDFIIDKKPSEAEQVPTVKTVLFEPLNKVEQSEPIKTEYRLIKSELNEQETTIPDNWDNEINELESFFNSTSMPNRPIKINSYTTINDVLKFIEMNLSIIKAQNGKVTYRPYLERLRQLKFYMI